MLTIRSKLILAALSSSAASFVVATVGLSGLSEVEARSTRATGRLVPQLVALERLLTATTDLRLHTQASLAVARAQAPATVALVSDGAQRSTRVRARVDEALSAVVGLGGPIGSIAEASTAQTAALEELSRAAAAVEHLTQRNAASSEESTSAAEELSGQATQMASMVGRFRLEATSAC